MQINKGCRGSLLILVLYFDRAGLSVKHHIFVVDKRFLVCILVFHSRVLDELFGSSLNKLKEAFVYLFALGHLQDQPVVEFLGL